MDDKKKTVVVGSLFVAMLAIGAFEFTKGSGDQAPAKPTDSKAKATAGGSAGDAKDGGTAIKDGTKDGDKKKDEKVKNPLLPALNPRDPFKPISLPNPTPAPASVAPPPKQVATPREPAPRESRLAPIPPMQIGGQLPTALPDGTQPLGPSGPIGGSAGPAPTPTFGYKLKGTMMGARPMAVFADSQGNERIVPVGSSLDGDSQVVSVQPGAVKVRTHGKTTTMTPGGNE